MNRSLTMDQVIGIEALRIALGQSIRNSDELAFGIFETLQINRDSISETELLNGYIEGVIGVTDLLKSLEVGVKDGEEANQFKGQGGESGEGTIGGTESNPSVIDEADAAILRQHRGG